MTNRKTAGGLTTGSCLGLFPGELDGAAETACFGLDYGCEVREAVLKVTWGRATLTFLH